ncbi:MAG TPA: type II toxin-antitoxin system VapC family toxin [Mycobacterium sp.]|nr:type II toxin-antitoxin system VapC family toxin [Mycobacterium sp.]HQE16763.1 type II toxin-antitoxin system VapC family toxin [Mycobacterium sp.]
MIYLDTSALIKQVRLEAESADLADWLDERHEMPLITSVLAEIELARAIRAVAPEGLPFVASVLARLNRFEIDALIRETAAAYPDPSLRSLDAIHLATAQRASAELSLTAFVTYDRRLAAAAQTLGFTTVAPGRSEQRSSRLSR